MASFVILSEFSSAAMGYPAELRRLAETVSQKIKAERPKVRWKDCYALMGRFDVVDIVEADSPAQAGEAVTIIRCHGQAAPETMQATPWKELLASL